MKDKEVQEMCGNAMSMAQCVKCFIPILTHMGWFERGISSRMAALKPLKKQKLSNKNSSGNSGPSVHLDKVSFSSFLRLGLSTLNISS